MRTGAHATPTRFGGSRPGVLITGAHGFVGRHLSRAVQPHAAWICTLDSAPHNAPSPAPATPYPLAAGLEFRADITDPEAVRVAIARIVDTLGAPTLVFHMAARAAVAESFTDPAGVYRTNVVGTAILLSCLADLCPGAKVLIPGTAHVYGRPSRADGLLDEDSPIEPHTHYGASKSAQEEVARLFGESGRLEPYVTRAFNHVGPGQARGFVLADFARRVAILEHQGGGALKVGNVAARRDFLDVRDVVDAYLTVVDQGVPGRPYNVASGETWSAQELLDLLLAEVDVPVTVESDPDLFRPADVLVLAGDAARLRALGWEPVHNLRDTIRETLDYWRDRISRESQEER